MSQSDALGGMSEGNHGIVPTNLQSLSHLPYPTDTRQLTSPQGEADEVSDGGMMLQALGGVNSPCGWYRLRGQLPSTGGREHTCTYEACENIHSWISLSGDLVFSHQQGLYGFKFPKRFLEIFSRDLTLLSILII